MQCFAFPAFISKAFLPCYVFTIFISIYFINFSFGSEVLRPRGVAISKAPLYQDSKEFKCFDGSLTVPYSYINDDYCDCPDGSDEPGTHACPQGYFHCTNAGHKPKYIRSSLVNDGICDCCDTSDEYNSSAQCVNDCKELGKIAREQAAHLAELFKASYDKKLLLSTDGKQKKEKMKADIAELENKKEEALKLKNEKEAIKNEIEEREKVVLDKYKEEDEERKKKKQEEDMARYMAAEKEQATQFFHLLDKNGDGKLHATELMEDRRFDQNKDGTVSEEEAKFFLHMKDYLELEEYTTTGWMIMKPLVTAEPVYEKEEVTDEQPESTTPEMPEELGNTDVEPPEEDVTDAYNPDDIDANSKSEAEQEESDYNENEDTDEYDIEEDTKDPDEDDDEDLEKRRRKFDQMRKKEEPPPEETLYDEETQKIVDEAKTARDEFNDAEHKVTEFENDIRNLQAKVDGDYGPDEEFATMQDQCYEFQHAEYTYKLCPFNRASQASKSGGGDTSLGTWGQWNGPEHNKYSKMLYEGGQGCWNGPARSTQVILTCGIENKVKAVSEPNRCVYLFEFETPAICSKPASQEINHDEL